MPAVPVSVTVITLNEATNIEACLASVAWADEVLVIDCGSQDGTPDLARAKGARVLVRDWPGYAAQKNFAAGEARHDWILSVDADERVTPALAEEVRDVLAREPRESGFRIPRVTWHLGRWIRTTDWYPDFHLRLYHRQRASWALRAVHESVTAKGDVGELSNDLQHFAYRDVGHHHATMERYTTLAAKEMYDQGRRAGILDVTLHPWGAFIRNYVLRRGFMDGTAGFIISTMNAYYVFLKFAKLWALDHPATRAGRPRRQAVITSVHIDTARTWRGGQNQVLQLVTGLESLGHPTGSWRTQRGELKRRAQEGLRFVGFSPRSEFDVQAAWQLGRVLRDVKPDVVHAHDPMAVALAAMALQMQNGTGPQPLVVAARRVDFHLKRHAFSKWKYRHVDVFIAASGRIGRSSSRMAFRATGSRSCTTA